MGCGQEWRTKMSNVYAYVRVSTLQQNEDRQMIAMSQVQVPAQNIYVEKQSGKDFNRPMYQKLLKKLRSNDVLYIKSIDRLGRNYEEILAQWNTDQAKRCGYCGIGYASVGYQKGKGSAGNINCRSRFKSFKLCE